MLPTFTKLRTVKCRYVVKKAKYSNQKLKLSELDIEKLMKEGSKMPDMGRFEGFMKSSKVDQYVALAKELQELARKDKSEPFLNPDAREALKDFADSPTQQKALEELISVLEKTHPVDYLRSSPVKAKDPNSSKRAVDSFVKHYATLYKTLANFSPEEALPEQFLSLPPNLQEVTKTYMKGVTDFNKEVATKYGDKAKPILSRVQLLTDYSNGVFFPNSIPTEPIRVAITGASGQIGYALAFRIASGGLFGPQVPVILQLLELPQAMETLQGVIMELQDCAFPTLKGIVATDSAERAFEGVDWALLVGASPRTKGMERGDLLLKNAEIFATQGKALNVSAKKAQTRVVVVGNPANTNALIAQQNAPNIPARNFSAMTRLDHNRGLAQLSSKLGVHVDDISNFVIWGNHSATQFPDISYATVPVSLTTGQIVPGIRPGQRPDNLGVRLVSDLVDEEWLSKDFIPTVQQRGAAIIAARGASSAQSAASALIDSVHDWDYGTNLGWTSAAVVSNGEYGVEKGLFFSYPVVYSSREWDIVKHLPIDEQQAALMEKSHQELIQERDAVVKFLPTTTATTGTTFKFAEGDELLS